MKLIARYSALVDNWRRAIIANAYLDRLMNAQQFDAALQRWLQTQPDYHTASYHIQVKLWASEVNMTQLTALELPGWVILDWGKHGLGLSAKHAVEANHSPAAGSLLDALDVKRLHAQVQLVVAPTPDWSTAYSATSLTPDLIKVLDTDFACVLNVTAERTDGDWQVVVAHQPPSDEPLANFVTDTA